MRVVRRTAHHEDMRTDSEGTWAVSYGDLVTLLLCFFILFFSVNHQRDRQISLQQSLYEMLAPHAKVTLDTGIDNNVSLGAKDAQGIDEVILKQIQGVPHKVGNKIIVEFPNTSFFRSGEITMTPTGVTALQKFVETYVPYAGTHIIGIHAYTDEKKVKADNPRFKDNLELSSLRAIAGLRVLQRAGIPLHVMRLGGFGELRMTQMQLKNLPEKERTRMGRDLARKIVLVIQPGERSDL